MQPKIIQVYFINVQQITPGIRPNRATYQLIYSITLQLSGYSTKGFKLLSILSSSNKIIQIKQLSLTIGKQEAACRTGPVTTLTPLSEPLRTRGGLETSPLCFVADLCGVREIIFFKLLLNIFILQHRVMWNIQY